MWAGAGNLSDPILSQYKAVYPVPGLALASDGIFIMGYDMNHHHTVCADANAPLDALADNLLSFTNLGAPASKLILGIPWYAYVKRCNDSYKPSPFHQCAGLSCIVGDAAHFDETAYAVGVWAIERMLANSSSGCIRSWSEQRGSPYLDCPATSPSPYPPFWAHPPPGEPLRTQTWYDDANSTKLKVELARKMKFGGVGAFTGENVGPMANGFARGFWEALGAVNGGSTRV